MPTQKQQVLDYIKQFGSITPLEAFADLGITRLAARISDLRHDGHEIKSVTVHGVSRLGRPMHYAKCSF